MAGKAFSVDTLRLKAELLYSRQGVLPFVAGALLLLAILFGVLVVPGQIAAKDSAEQQLETLTQQQLRMRAKPDLSLSPSQSLTRVLADPQTTNAQLRVLLDFAANNGVNVVQADYRRITDVRANSQVAYSQLQISLPVKADYPSLRRFIYTALAQMPALSLDQLIVKREQSTGAQLDAQLVLSLWQKAPRVIVDSVAAGGTN
ncbi:MAG: hypothetical protein JWM03_323 [Rhodocyclales bacterium]|nr:hypothetical protein [Rhodocyclales bacterium]MDB5887451.1 hypothetical protein [Rhodocyclales bacterium]